MKIKYNVPKEVKVIFENELLNGEKLPVPVGYVESGDYSRASANDLQEIMEKYKLIHLSDYFGLYFLVPRD